ncbi:MAG: peptidoglycan-binding protein, partial [Clostridia bacterium]|nr:peptidoglycan-binding protein [Clostridia bacterium]
MKRGFMRRFLCAMLCAALVLGSLAFADSVQGAENYKTLTYGIRNDSPDSTAVKALQDRLKALGFLSKKTESTGGYWESTAEAVAAFQQAAGLPVNGKVASPETQAAMFASNAVKSDGSTMEAPTPVTYTTSLNRSASYNRDVKEMQKRLQELGYLSDRADGSYGGNTAMAVAAFQRAAGLPINPDVASAEMLTA